MAEEQDWRLDAGEIYVTVPACFWHRVHYPEGRTVAVQFRSAVFHGWRSKLDRLMAYISV